jgi:cytochrome c oxidase cbb3-type subunit III
MSRLVWISFAFLGVVTSAGAQDKGRVTFERVCGSCHKPEIGLSTRRSRAQWQETVNSMVGKGLKAPDDELTLVIDYLSANYGNVVVPATPSAPPPVRGRGPVSGMGADDKHVVDAAAADRGRSTYAAECINCHGTHARGSDNGADLVRSLVVLHDRYGNELGPFLRKGHPTQTTPSANLTQTQIEELSHLLHRELYATLRGASDVQNVLTGDPKAGEAFFNGAGRCSTCHSPTGDFAGIAKRYDPVNLQQRFLFPQGGRGGRGGPASRPVTVTVTPPSGTPVSGTLVQIDDFNLSLRDASGEYHAWKRTPGLKVVKNNPFAAHIELLDQYTDKNMHDIVAYLETLK